MRTQEQTEQVKAALAALRAKNGRPEKVTMVIAARWARGQYEQCRLIAETVPACRSLMRRRAAYYKRVFTAWRRERIANGQSLFFLHAVKDF